MNTVYRALVNSWDLYRSATSETVKRHAADIVVLHAREIMQALGPAIDVMLRNWCFGDIWSKTGVYTYTNYDKLRNRVCGMITISSQTYHGCDVEKSEAKRVLWRGYMDDDVSNKTYSIIDERDWLRFAEDVVDYHLIQAWFFELLLRDQVQAVQCPELEALKETGVFDVNIGNALFGRT